MNVIAQIFACAFVHRKRRPDKSINLVVCDIPLYSLISKLILKFKITHESVQWNYLYIRVIPNTARVIECYGPLDPSFIPNLFLKHSRPARIC